MNNRIGLVGSLALLLLTWGVSAWAWTVLPASGRFPVHWGIRGTANGYGDRFEVVALLPLTMMAVTALFAVLPRLDPRRPHLQQSGRSYAAVWIAVLALLAALQVALVLSALGRRIDVAEIALAGAGALFVVVGLTLGPVRSNFVFGVRTPWTLASERVWRETHRVAGPVFGLLGAVVILAAVFTSNQIALWVLLAGLVAVALGLSAYSYVIWRPDDGERQPGRQPWSPR